MTNPKNGIFDPGQLDLIEAAHRRWCATHAVDPSSTLGQRAAAGMIEAYRSGMTSGSEMMAAVSHLTPCPAV